MELRFPPSFVSFFVFYIFSYLLSKSWAAFLGAWCPLPAFRSCFVEFTRRLNALLMNLWGRKCSPHPTPPPSWLLPLVMSFENYLIQNYVYWIVTKIKTKLLKILGSGIRLPGLVIGSYHWLPVRHWVIYLSSLYLNLFPQMFRGDHSSTTW